MRIINQSRDASYEFESSTVSVSDEMIFLRNNYTNAGHGIVGSYVDEMRAKEVLIDIHEKYCTGDANYFMPKE